MAKSVVLFRNHQANMVEAWSAQLVCTKHKDGTFSLKLSSFSEGGTMYGPSTYRIRTPEAFIAAIENIEDLFGPAITTTTIREFLPTLRMLDTQFAARVRKHLDELTDTEH